MINKRLLIKNLLTYSDENSFYDKKLKLNLDTKQGKAKFLKHICALSNSNPKNNSYIVIGVSDKNNRIIGVDFFDDSKIQNLVNAYLDNPPKVQYENIHFPILPSNKVLGLVTIKPKSKPSSFKKNITSVVRSSVYVRVGSNSIPIREKVKFSKMNFLTVKDIENSSRNNLTDTLEDVIQFLYHRYQNIQTNYQVFKDLYIICWAGVEKLRDSEVFYSRVDIELINENMKLFYSTYDQVKIVYTEDCFTITEFVPLTLFKEKKYYPLENVTITFFNNGYYKIESELVFSPPSYDKALLGVAYKKSLELLEIIDQPSRDAVENHDEFLEDLKYLPSTLFICFLNGYQDAIKILFEYKHIFKNHQNQDLYTRYKEVLRVYRKLKYN